MSPDQELAPSPAATVVLMRGGSADAGLELLLLRRNARLVFYGGAWVFPGGRVDERDGDARDGEHAARNAAVREVHEETGLVVDPGELVPFARWLTPPGRPRRFDTWYFAARAPEGEVHVDRGEVDAHRWMTPGAAREARAAGHIELPPPTFVTLVQLAAHADADAAHAMLRRAPVQRFVPRPCEVDGGVIHLYEGDAGYAARDPDTSGPLHRLVALAHEWRYERSP